MKIAGVLLTVGGITILLCILWNYTPLRTFYYRMRGRYITWRAKCKMSSIYIFYYNHRRLFQFIFDMALFWFICEWRNGLIVQKIITGGRTVWSYVYPIMQKIWRQILELWEIIKKAWLFLVYISPYGRNAVSNPAFRYALNICSVCVAITGILVYVLTMDVRKGKRIKAVITGTIMTFGEWYLCFAACYLICKIPILYNVLGLAAAAGLGVVLGIAVMCIFYTAFAGGSDMRKH